MPAAPGSQIFPGQRILCPLPYGPAAASGRRERWMGRDETAGTHFVGGTAAEGIVIRDSSIIELHAEEARTLTSSPLICHAYALFLPHAFPASAAAAAARSGRAAAAFLS
jgi:hypothetical protein